MSAPLQAVDLRFIHDVAARRFAGGEAGSIDEAAIDEAVAAAAEGTAFVRAATLAAVLVQRRAFSSAPLQTALLVLHCALSLEGFSLVAPQGVLAGMIQQLAAEGDGDVVARWVEDRAVPTASG
jgi:prophage maintenance system killer protein